jgi:quinol monooxygenase YgiN
MIQVIATIELKPDCRDEYLRILNENVPRVKAEEGCLAYEPSIDVDSGLPVQGGVRPNVVTLVEAWTDLDALHAHLKAPHMLEYREAVKNHVTDIRIQVLKPV